MFSCVYLFFGSGDEMFSCVYLFVSLEDKVFSCVSLSLVKKKFFFHVLPFR